MSAATGFACGSHFVQSAFRVVGIAVAASTRWRHLSFVRSVSTVMFGSVGSVFGWVSWPASPLAQPVKYSYSSASPNAA